MLFIEEIYDFFLNVGNDISERKKNVNENDVKKLIALGEGWLLKIWIEIKSMIDFSIFQFYVFCIKCKRAPLLPLCENRKLKTFGENVLLNMFCFSFFCWIILWKKIDKKIIIEYAKNKETYDTATLYVLLIDRSFQ